MIKVFGLPNSRSSRVTWVLEELGVDYQFTAIDFSKGDNRSDWFLQVSPAGKVPAIQDGDFCMTESGAIVAYLADKYGAGRLAPVHGTEQRATHDQWCYFALTELEQPLWTMGKHKFALPAEHRKAEIMPTAQWEFQKALGLLSDGLGKNSYIMGDEFTFADILLAHTLKWGMAFKQPIEQQNLQSYAERLLQRPAKLHSEQKEQAAVNN